MSNEKIEPAAAPETNGYVTTNAPPLAVPDDNDNDKAVRSTRDAQPNPTTTRSSSVVQKGIDKALGFLSTASNETLGACLAGLGATTYFVLGRVGLVIIGVAGGVVLHATWEGIRSGNRDEATKKVEEERRREAGIDIAKRLLQWREESRLERAFTDDGKIYANQQLNFSSFGPEIETALNTFTDAVIKDYVLNWYDYAVPGEQSFPDSCRKVFTAFVLSVSSHLRHKRSADVFLDFVTNSSSILIVFLTELSAALSASPNSSAETAVATYLKMKPDSSLAYMLDQDSQKIKLGDVAEDTLQNYLDPKAYNCPPVHVFLKQILAEVVLGYTVTMCSAPVWINEWIVYGLEESETTKEVMNIVDAGVEGRPDAQAAHTAELDSAKDGPQSQPTEPQVIDASNEKATPLSPHKRQISKAEEAMDEAMREAKRLTELMIEEDRRRTEEEERKHSTPTSARDSSEVTTQGIPTPTSSQSDQDREDEPPASGEVQESITDTPTTPNAQFTNFDQLVPTSQPTALSETPPKSSTRPLSVALTLHNANISISDDSVPGERTSIKAKPTIDYLVQIEPVNSSVSGWMITRKYADFETLHEVLRRISVITGARFTEAHSELPKWKVHTKASLRTELERYLMDAVHFQSLAESEGMKRFLEKDQGLSKSLNSNKGFGWPTPDAFGKLGGDMMNVLTKAPKQVAGGGKAVFGGVAGLVGSAGAGAGKRASTSQSSPSPIVGNTADSDGGTQPAPPRSSIGDNQSIMTDPLTGTYLGSISSGRDSSESARVPPRSVTEQRRGSAATSASTDVKPHPNPSPSRPASISSQTESTGRVDGSLPASTSQVLSLDETINLPPPPSSMPEDYDVSKSPTSKKGDTSRQSKLGPQTSENVVGEKVTAGSAPKETSKPQSKPLTERETSVAVELMFAVVTQLYTLSGVWQIRRTLLTAAKAFLLRPGNPQLLSIRDLLQKSLLDSNLSDSGLASHIYKLRENSLPTAQEMEAWKRDYPEKTEEQKKELRIKARKLLITKGMPQALTSVMGAAASGEALGKVFDALQVPEVSRGLVFGLLLQALRVVTH